MANNHSNLTSLFTDIADAIRAKTGSSDPIVADQFPEAIEGISGGGADDGFPIGDGNTHIWLSISEGRMSPILGLYPNGTVTVDWGDGTNPSVVTGTSSEISTSNSKEVQHSYSAVGDYLVTIKIEGEARINQGFIRRISNDARDTYNYGYANSVRKIEFGSNTILYGSTCRFLSSLTDFSFADGCRFDKYNSTFFSDCFSLRKAVFPLELQNTGAASSIFSGCRSLATVVLPDGLSLIGQHMFNTCYALAYVAIPSTVESIEAGAFYTCKDLSVVDFSRHETIPALKNTNAFNGVSSDLQIRVPAALVDEWKAATNWSTYADYIVGV